MTTTPNLDALLAYDTSPVAEVVRVLLDVLESVISEARDTTQYEVAKSRIAFEQAEAIAKAALDDLVDKGQEIESKRQQLLAITQRYAPLDDFTPRSMRDE